MYAVIQTGGKQYRVAQGDTLKIEKLAGEEGDTIKFDRVLMLADGDNIQVGAPFIDGGLVNATVVKHARADKIWVFKLRRRKNSRRQQGHRQHYTEVKINSIEAARE
jgi:large subunit ribosomal protein L21